MDLDFSVRVRTYKKTRYPQKAFCVLLANHRQRTNKNDVSKVISRWRFTENVLKV